MTKEKPMLFSAPMVVALLNGTKSQTRRVVKPILGRNAEWTPWEATGTYRANGLLADIPLQARGEILYCPYEVGMTLWVRETWMPTPATSTSERASRPYWYRVGTLGNEPKDLKWKPSIVMPRVVSRITLEITGVRVERLQEISESDAKAEGIFEFGSLGFYGYDKNGTPGKHCFDTARETYAALWDEINGKRKGCAWADSPWVWRIEFKSIKP